ncbi:hypothetical protein niasHT_000370 [Heterodera trifolii]|uniref:Calcineurin-like phosphoesterase domain-containing protein n=1 Tax=Heterodera trifolii TaxID=157864 RepID=A0ABD2MCQ8_9BILA
MCILRCATVVTYNNFPRYVTNIKNQAKKSSFLNFDREGPRGRSALFAVDKQQFYSENDPLQQNGAFCSSVVWSVGHRNGTIGALCLECGQVLWEMDTDAQLTDHIVNNHPEYMPNSLVANVAPATADSQIVPTYVDEQGELWQCVDIATNGETAEEIFQRNGAQPLQQQQHNEEKFLFGCAFYGASLSCCFRAIWVGQQRAIFQSLGHNHPPVTVEAFPMQGQSIDQSSSAESVMETIERVLQQDNSTFVDAAGKEWHWLADVSAPGGETELRRACRANGMKKSVLFDTLQKVTNAISAHFPDAVLLPVLGNHDSAPGNSFTDHPAKQQIYEKMFKMWEQWIGPEGKESFTRDGYYRAETSAGLFLVLNTNIYYESNPLRKELVEPDDPTGQFDFLQFELEKARQKGVPVHILGHVPPGAFEEYSVNKLEMEQIPQKYNQKLVDLLVEYAPQIGWIFFGHYHTDTFRVIKNSDGKAVQRFFTAPALTPAFQKNNPAFRVADYNTDTWELEDMKTYYVELDELNRNGADGTRAKLEYSMRDAFGGLDAHIQKAKRNGTVFDALIRHNHVMYEANSNWGLNATQRSVHLCALEFVD